MKKKNRIVHGLNEIAGQNTYSVQGLRYIGEDAKTVVYCKHPFDYKYDQCLNINKNSKILFPLNAFKLLAFCISSLFKYDTYHYHFGYSALNCYDLWLYRLFRKRLFFEFHGSDLRDYHLACKIMGMEYDAELDSNPKIHKRNKKIGKNATGIIIHDNELIKYLPPIKNQFYIVPLRVDISQFIPCYPKKDNTNIRIVHAPSSRSIKGTKYIIAAIESLKQKYDNVELVLVEGKTQKEAFEIYKTADIIIDQVFLGTYGVFSIESMALGKPVVTSISEEMQESFPEELPIISVNKDNIEEQVEKLILDPELRYELGVRGREYVETYHDYRVVANVLKNVYEGTQEPLRGRDVFRQVKEFKENFSSKSNV